MARLIVKSPYIQCGKQNAGSYLRYIATRERVEIIPDDRPPTRKQEQLITKLAKDFPDVKELLEYEDYVQKPTKANASSLITLALEEHWKQVQQTDGYLKYIATRPRAERLGDHGLFGDADHVDLDAAMSELGHYTGNVWTHILSMHREDAERLGYNNAQAWRALLRAHRNDIAAAMHIPPQDFRWYAAFRNEGHHPHIHMMAWSVKPGQAHLDRDGIRSIRSQLTNDIFQQELLHVYEQKSVSRDELVKESRKVMLELSRQMRDTICEHTQAEQMIWKLSQQLGEVKGKKSYGYLPRPMKRQVGEIVDQLEQIPIVNECYQKWWELQCQVNEFYSGKKQQRPPLSKQKEFRAIRNAVIREAEKIRLGKITFEDEKMEERGEWVENWEVSHDCLRLRARIEGNKLPLEQRDEAAEDLERLAEYGDVHAQYFLGLLYRDGGLLLPDTERATHWLELAARRDLPAAQYALGKLYLTGNGVPKDEEAAQNCFRMANAFGHPYAQYVLERQEQWQRPQLLMTVSRLLYHMSNIFRDNVPAVPAQPRLHIDRKRMQELQELRIALGHQPDDHEEEQTQTWCGMTMKGW
ncbi:MULTISPECIES: MobP3 family relaxase [Eubacteriales]|uniref:MobP3 family relaxase n=1 Tax=Eubacteriales TaxID=186802 RepID=UPI0029435EB6|nr:MobP3 family relaxase [Dysosmobacter welbionis]